MGERDDERIAEFIEHLGAVFEAAGMPRIAARIFVLLLSTDSGALTAAEIGESLHISPAAVSTGVAYLHQAGMTMRLREPGSRRQVHRLVADDWYTTLITRSGILRASEQLMYEGAGAAGGRATPAGHRLWLNAQLFRFLDARLGELVREWAEQRAALEGDRPGLEVE